MRTMRALLLLLLLSLDAAAGEPKLFNADDCGTIHKCYVPKMCKDKTITKIDAITNIVVEVVSTDIQILDNCPALIRLHAYSPSNVYVSIESYRAGTKSITFQQDDSSCGALGTPPTSRLSCSIDSKGAITGKYGDKSIPLKNKPTDNKLKCEFIVKLQATVRVFGTPTLNDCIRFNVDGKMSKDGRNHFLEDVKCDPSKLKFNNGNERSKVYAPVINHGGKYQCANHFTMEYKLENEIEYKPAILTCVYSLFAVNGGTPGAISPWIDIRCVTEAKYFCDYDVKTKKDTPKLERSYVAGQPSTLKCPFPHEHLMVEGAIKMKAQFECLNFGSNQYWAVVEANAFPLLKNGPEVYCTKKVECHLIRTISESAVVGGILENGLPTCLAYGTLKIGGKTVTTRCDDDVGEFKYTIEGGSEQIIAGDTKFECEYQPQLEVEAKNNENKNKIQQSGVIALAVCIVIGAAILIGGVTLSYCRFRISRKRAKEAMMKDEKAWNKYCMDDNERKKDKATKKKEDRRKEIAAGCLDQSNMSDLIMSNMRTSAKSVSNNTTFDREELNAKVYDHPQADNDMLNAKKLARSHDSGSELWKRLVRSVCTVDYNELMGTDHLEEAFEVLEREEQQA